MSFDVGLVDNLISDEVSIPLEQGSVFRHTYTHYWNNAVSQSLWNRAVSFDKIGNSDIGFVPNVSIPLEQGSVFRQQYQHSPTILNLRLNPFGTGQCLSTEEEQAQEDGEECLNPFGTGQCLSTA